MVNFNYAIVVEPDYVEAYIGRGRLKETLGDSNGASDDFAQAREPGYAE